MLSPLACTDHGTQDTLTFVDELNRECYRYFVSFDIISLFTNIPLDDTLDIAVDYLTKDKNFNLSKTELKQLLTFPTSQTDFMFKNVFYDQID